MIVQALLVLLGQVIALGFLNIVDEIPLITMLSITFALINATIIILAAHAVNHTTRAHERTVQLYRRTAAKIRLEIAWYRLQRTWNLPLAPPADTRS